MKKSPQKNPKRGEVWLVNFDTTVGSEIKKTRPALILQNDVGNRFSAVTIVAALSSYPGGELYPTEVMVSPPEGGLEKQSVVMLNQILTVDQKRLVARIGTVKTQTVRAAENALLISLGFVGV